MGTNEILSEYLNKIQLQNQDIWSNLIQNKVDYFTLKHFDNRLTNIESKKLKLKNFENKCFKTLDLLKGINKKVNFILIKTWCGCEFIPSDIDVLIQSEKDFRLIKKLLLQNNFLRSTVSKLYFWDNHNEKYKEIWKNKNDKYFLIHLHKCVAWKGVKYLDKKNIFKNTINKKIFGIDFLIPSFNEDFLISSAHVLFETHKITLKDFIHFKKLMNSKRINMKKIMETSKFFGWGEGIFIILKYYKKIDKKFRNKEEFILPLTIPKNLLFKLRIKKMINDVSKFKYKEFIHEIKSYFLDFISLFLVRPIRGYFK